MRTFNLRNEAFRLCLSPEAGCHWDSLEIPVEGVWRALLHPGEGFQGGSYIMAPWCNRVNKALFDYDGQTWPLRPTFFDGTAIHGDVHNRPWTVLSSSERHLEASLISRDVPDFNFPFSISLRTRVQLENTSLVASVTVTNEATRPIPVGFGFHPFFRRRLVESDPDVEFRFSARRVYPILRGIPLGPAVPVEGRTDRRRWQAWGEPDFDDNFTDFETPFVEWRYPGARVQVRMEMDPVFTHCFLFSPTGADFFAVEPMTMASDGFNQLARGWTQTGVQILAPGASLSGAVRIVVQHGGL